VKRKASPPEQIIGKRREVEILLSKEHKIREVSTDGCGQEAVNEGSANMASKWPCHLLMVQIQYACVPSRTICIRKVKESKSISPINGLHSQDAGGVELHDRVLVTPEDENRLCFHGKIYSFLACHFSQAVLPKMQHRRFVCMRPMGDHMLLIMSSDYFHFLGTQTNCCPSLISG